MLSLIAIIICCAFLLALTYIHKSWRSHSTFRAAAAKYGCERPTKYSHWDPFCGYDLIKKRTEAVKAGRQMELYMQHFATYGKTWEEKFYDVRMINTMESRNIQQVCALGFQDYCKPSRHFAHPFLGRGIFSEDGPAWKRSRDLVKPVFSRSELSDIDSFCFHVDRFLDLIPRDGSTIDLQSPLHKLVGTSVVVL